jgi:hypothetical protein
LKKIPRKPFKNLQKKFKPFKKHPHKSPQIIAGQHLVARSRRARPKFRYIPQARHALVNVELRHGLVRYTPRRPQIDPSDEVAAVAAGHPHRTHDGVEHAGVGWHPLKVRIGLDERDVCAEILQATLDVATRAAVVRSRDCRQACWDAILG